MLQFSSYDLNNPYEKITFLDVIRRMGELPLSQGMVFHSYNRDYSYLVKGTANQVEIRIKSHSESAKFKEAISKLSTADKFTTFRVAVKLPDDSIIRSTRRTLTGSENYLLEIQARLVSDLSNHYQLIHFITTPTMQVFNLFKPRVPLN